MYPFRIFFSDISVNGRTDAANSPQDLVRQITPSASLTGNASQINNYWTYLYKGIKDANTLLTRSETAEFDNEDQRKEIEGLACFHRAYRYYRLGISMGIYRSSQKKSPGHVMIFIQRSVKQSCGI